MKNVSRVALAICVALGLVACKSSNKSHSAAAPQPVNFVEKMKDEKVAAAIKLIAEGDIAGQKTAEEVKKLDKDAKITAHKQTYSSYIAVLSEKDEKDENNKLYDVLYAVKLEDGSATKESDAFKLAKLDANYKGKMTYTVLKAGEDYLTTKSTDVDFKVKNEHISGSALISNGDEKSGKIKANFEKAKIQVEDYGLAFAAGLKVEKFNKDAKEEDAPAKTLAGKYNGMFAGNNADEVVGTFELNDGSAKGAFAAKKEVKEPAAPAPAGVQGGQ